MNTLVVDYYNKLGIDIISFIPNAIYNAMLDRELHGKMRNCLMSYCNPGELAFLYSTGND